MVGTATVTADDIHGLYRPTYCRRRVYLRANCPDIAAQPSEYDQLLMRLGLSHEQAHVSLFPEVAKPEYPRGELSAGADATRSLIDAQEPIIYQGVLTSPNTGLAGIPDLLILGPEGYTIRDVKLTVNLDKHLEIPLQLSLYARLFEETTGLRPSAIQVACGDGTVVDLEVVEVDEVVSDLVRLKTAPEETDEAVGWSKCSPCVFKEHCWGRAEADRDPGVVYGVDQGLRNMLTEAGISTYDDMAQLATTSLADMRRPWGPSLRRVGEKLAERVLRQVSVLIDGGHSIVDAPELPLPGPCIHFDIEADPHDEALGNNVYLWGVLVDLTDGSDTSYWGEVTGATDADDREGWFCFLQHVGQLLNELGPIPVVHYAHYEKTWVRKYIERYGDPDGHAQALLDNLWDLAEGVKAAVCLPIPSYSLKLVEGCAGFERSQEDYGSLWSVVRYHEWLAVDQGAERQRIEEELLRYNQEDCEAMRDVLAWLRDLS